MTEKQNNNRQEQEIGFKNYNPAINSLNNFLDNMVILGYEMFRDPNKLEEYYIMLKNLKSRWSTYIRKEEKQKIDIDLEKIRRFLYEGRFPAELQRYNIKKESKQISYDIKNKINMCINAMLNIFESMNEEFALNGLTPTPEKKIKKVWEDEEHTGLAMRKKAIEDIIFYNNYN